MNVGDVVKRVRAAIDELMVNDSGFLSNSDEANLRDVIVDKIGYGLNWVLENAPSELLDIDSLSELTPTELAHFQIGDDGVGRLQLPDDLLRIVEARLSSWFRAPEIVSAQSEVYLMQQNRYTRGTWDRPVSVLTHQGTTRLLEMYSAKTADDTLQLLIVRKPTAIYNTDTQDSASVGVPIRLEPAFVYHVAGLTMLAFREEIASSLLELSEKYLGRS